LDGGRGIATFCPHRWHSKIGRFGQEPITSSFFGSVQLFHTLCTAVHFSLHACLVPLLEVQGLSNAGTLGNVMTDNFFEVICCGIKLGYRFLEAGIEIPKPR
jgi:hypothetical protein